MTDFLNFLNTADISTLTKVPGITDAIAKGIIKARPFEQPEDVLEVRGMGKALLAKLQLFAETQENESESRAMIPVQEDALPIEENTPENESFQSRFGKAFNNFLRSVIRLIMLLALIVIIGVALYYGLPYLNKTFIVPVEQNAAQISDLETQIADLQSQVDELNGRIDSLEKSIDSHTESIRKLETMQAALETELQKNNDETLLALKHEVMMTRVLDTLARARLYLAQSNFGMAKVDIQNARDLLAELQNETKDELLTQVIARLDLALGNLPAFPVVAAGDLEIAWQVLTTGEKANEATPTPFVEPFLTTTPTPNAEATATQ